MQWQAEELPHLKGYTVEWAEPGNYWLSRRDRIFHSKDLQAPFSLVSSIETTSWKSLASSLSRLAQRLLRFMVTNVIPLPNGDVFVTFDRSVGVIRDGKYRTLAGLERPCRVLRAACAVDDKGDVYFGEYLANNERGAMRIYRFASGSDGLEVVHSFAAGSIKHIHGIYFDPFTKALFCLTGDDLRECRMIRSFDGFQTLQTIGEGDETWRAVSLIFKPDAIFYGMDAEYRSNHIYRLDRATDERTSLGEVNGTVFYSKNLGDDLFFATTAENAPSQTENVAAIWNVDSKGELNEIVRFEKDRWHPTLFMFGLIHFPYANLIDNEMYFNLVATKGDSKTYRLTRRGSEAA
jgi:hypothetical protein